MNKRLMVTIGVLLVVVGVAVAAGVSHVRKIVTVPFNGSSTYTFATTADNPGLISLDMSFVGAAVSNTFALTYVRSGVTHKLVTESASMKSLVWYPPQAYFFQTGDILSWSNSSTNSAIMTVNIDF